MIEKFDIPANILGPVMIYDPNMSFDDFLITYRNLENELLESKKTKATPALPNYPL